MNEDIVEEYLKKNNIPYKRNIKIRHDHSKDIFTEIDFVIPGSIIEVKSIDVKFYKTHCVDDIQKQIIKMVEYVGNDFIVYLVVSDFDSSMDHFQELNKQIKIIKDLSQIKHNKLPYYCNHAGLIRSLASFHFTDYERYVNLFNEDLSKNKQGLFFGPDYYKAISIMNEEEMNRLSKYNFTIVDKFDETLPHILLKNVGSVNKKMFNVKDKFVVLNIFDFHIPLCGLSPTQRLPCRIVDNITKYCNVCQKIFFINSKFHTCESRKRKIDFIS